MKDLFKTVRQNLDLLEKEYDQMIGTQAIFNHLKKADSFDAELSDRFFDCLLEGRREFEYEYEGVTLVFHDIQGYARQISGTYDSPPYDEMEVESYEVEASYYDDFGDYENIIVEGALLELIKLKLKITE